MSPSRILTWVAAAVLVIGVFGFATWWKLFRSPAPDELVGLLPPEGGPILYLDVARLRSSGMLDLLAGKAGSEEADYQKFVEATGFDYRRDLNAVAVMLRQQDTLVVAKGKFKEDKLAAYARSHGGRCQLRVCVMEGSSKLRQISWMVTLDNALLLAVSPDPQAVRLMGSIGPPPKMAWPTEPVWLRVPKAELHGGPGLPPGLSTLLNVLADANEATVTLGTTGTDMELRLAAPCANPKQAALIAEHMNETTALFMKLLAREGQKPDGKDLSGVLAGGKFHSEADVVLGAWPLTRGYLESLLK